MRGEKGKATKLEIDLIAFRTPSPGCKEPLGGNGRMDWTLCFGYGLWFIYFKTGMG